MNLFSKLTNTERRPFFSHVFRLGGGTAIGQFVVILSTPIITRMYSPHEMGILSLLVAFIGFAAVGTGLRYELAIVSANDDQEAGLLTWCSIFASIPVATFSSLVLLGMIRFDILSYGTLPWWSAPIVGCLLIVIQLFMSLRYWFVRRINFSIIGKALIVQGIGRALVPIFAGFMSIGWIGLFMGEVAGRVLGIYKMLVNALPILMPVVRKSSRKMFFSILRKYGKFPGVVLPSSLIDALSGSLPLPVISYLYGAEKAGLFFLVMRFGTLPAAFISTSIADVFHARVSEDYRVDTKLLRPFLLTTAKKLLKIGIAIYIPVAVLSPFLFGIIFGERWSPAGPVMAILAPLALFSLVVNPLSRILLVANRVESKLLADGVCLVLPLLGIFASHFFYGNFKWTIVTYSFMHIIANLFYLYIIWLSSKPRYVQAT